MALSVTSVEDYTRHDAHLTDIYVMSVDFPETSSAVHFVASGSVALITIALIFFSYILLSHSMWNSLFLMPEALFLMEDRPTDFQFSRSGVAFQNKRTTAGFYCYNCGRHYRWKHSLTAHLKNECGKEPSLQCPFCVYRAKQMSNFRRHIRVVHRQAVTI
ncbi:MDS1 and EVI1 complex locus protein EVI1-B-like [Schistocerca piceifrons]|uniref:MDS1 and EVI1 complex locus protein EVI1-B-like n=1 Tax=Schistocerca piceifrons TaxID=274613 RepID=UPI001F5EC5CF|nr:MDS1 and EVI1 complex locus protein EVI1-B-like [Schistocerca piceifrons]